METLTEGKPADWVGKTVRCECGFSGRLEEKDHSYLRELAVLVRVGSIGKLLVDPGLDCPFCHGRAKTEDNSK